MPTSTSPSSTTRTRASAKSSPDDKSDIIKYWPVVAFLLSTAISAVAGMAASNDSNERYKSAIDTRISLTTPLREETRKQVNDHEGRLVRLETQESFTRSDIAEIKADVKELVHVEHVERAQAASQ